MGRHNGAQPALTAVQAQNAVRSIARLPVNVRFTRHAIERMIERAIDHETVLRILCAGYVDEAPKQLEDGKWQCKVVRKLENGREAGVVTILLSPDELLVRTVEWEDGR